MIYNSASLQPDVPLTYEEEKPTMLGFLADGCCLEDTLPQGYAGNPNLVSPEHQPIFSTHGDEKFAYPDPEHINGLVAEGMVTVHLSIWEWNEVFGVSQNLRRFIITDKAERYLSGLRVRR